jgi:predicted enzyme related to lactoylglutathione lyase
MCPAGRPHRRAWSDISTPVSRIAVFTDPDGNRIGLVSR